MAGRKLNKERRAAHLAQVARLYIAGTPQVEIARLTNRSKSQISRDIRDLYQHWRESVMIDITAKIGEQLERLTWQERELWAAWERSKTEAVEEFTERSTAPGPPPPPAKPGQSTSPSVPPREHTKASIRRTKRTGDVACMTQLLSIAQERSKLLGLYPAEKRDVVAEQRGVGIPLSLLHRIREARDLDEAESTEPHP